MVPRTKAGRRDAVRALLFSRATVMRGLAELAKDGGEEVYTSFVSDRFEAALEDGFNRDSGADTWAPWNEGTVTSAEAGSGLNLSYDGADGGGWESAETTVERILRTAVSSCRSLVPVLAVQKKRWEVEDWRRDRPGFDASDKQGGMASLHDVMDPASFQKTAPVFDVRPQVYASEVSLYSKAEGPVVMPHPDTAGTMGYSVGTGVAPRSNMVEPTRYEKAKEYMGSAEFQRLFHGGGRGTDMTGPPLGTGSIRRGAEASTNDRVDEFMRGRRPTDYAVDGLDSVSMISGQFRG